MPGRALFAGAVVAVLSAALPSFASAGTVQTAWCGAGTPPVQTNRVPDLAAGPLVHVMYAHPADSTDRFDSMASAIATDLATADTWWRRQDPTRTLRFDLFAFPGCSTQLGNLDLADVTLPHGMSYYAPLATRFERVVDDVTSAPFSFRNPFDKYVVYLDGNVEEPRVCGQGGSIGGGLPDFGLVYPQACFQRVGDGATAAITAIHELVHALGSVPSGAPHECAAPNSGHVCDSETDLMYWLNSAGALDDEVLDVHRDDYYGTGLATDLRNSPWLSHLDAPQFALALATDGVGTGRVTSTVPGVDCTAACSSTWDAQSAVTLTASPDEGLSFTGWSGACSGRGDCLVTMDAAKTVTATFGPPNHRLRLSQQGKGRIISSPGGIACPSRCGADFPENSSVSLRAVAATGYAFAGWSGACRGRGACALTISADESVRATFNKKR